jgi:16S rRNA (cytosine1402-N4)-methyltransferase
MHRPVLLKEVIEFLDPKTDENFIDATFGDGGHALEILKRTAPNGKVLGIDLDQKAIEKFIPRAIEGFDGRGLDTRSIFIYASEPPTATAETSRQSRSGVEPLPTTEGKRLFLIQGNFAQIGEIARSTHFDNVDGVLFDLGFRTGQLEGEEKGERGGRGFSFQKDEPLDMRYDSTAVKTAEEIINSYSERDLERIFTEYGEEGNSRRIARAITDVRHKNRIRTTGELVEVIDRTVRHDVKILARIFQALRIEVNSELENIESGLKDAWDIVGAEGRIAVISFHSLEDRIVKNFFVDKKQAGIAEILTKKPVTASEDEIRDNSKSRSAKMRVIRKLGVRH